MRRALLGSLIGLALALPLPVPLLTPVARADDAVAQALLTAGDQLDDQGDEAGAVADYSQALQMNPGTAVRFDALIDRAYAYAGSGQYSEAFADIAQAHRLKPGDSTALSARYWVQLDLFQFADVLDTIDQMTGMKPVDPYAPLLRFVAAGRLGRDGRAALARAIPQNARNRWPQAVAQMFLGQVSPLQLLQWVDESDNAEATCEAPYYVGEYQLIHNQRDLAQAAFAESTRDECRPVTEYYAAQRELSALSSGSYQ